MRRSLAVTGLVLSATGIAVVALSILAFGYLPRTGPGPKTIDYIHPGFSIPAVLLVATAYLLKKRGKEHFLAHYVVGTAAITATVVAVLLGTSVASIQGRSSFFSTLPFHLLVAIVALGLVLFHGSEGLAMLFFGRTSGRYAMHRRLAKWVIVVYAIQGALGLSILLALLLGH